MRNTMAQPILEALTAARRPAPAGIRYHTHPSPTGHCFEVAGWFVTDVQRARLVHGVVLGVKHAFAVLGDLVYDPCIVTGATFYDAAAYHAALDVEIVCVFDRRAVRRMRRDWRPCNQLLMRLPVEQTTALSVRLSSPFRRSDRPTRAVLTTG
jgi:hypothetical protein